MQTHKKIMLRSFAKRICVADNSASTANQLYRHRKHQQPVRQVRRAQAISYTSSASKKKTSYTSNPGPENKQLFLHTAQSTNNQLYKQRKHQQHVYTGNQLHGQPLTQATHARQTARRPSDDMCIKRS